MIITNPSWLLCFWCHHTFEQPYDDEGNTPAPDEPLECPVCLSVGIKLSDYLQIPAPLMQYTEKN